MRFLVFGFVAFLSACGTSDTTSPICVTGQARCEGTRVVTCGLDATWSATSDCPKEGTCRNDACVAPTAQQLAQADAAVEYAQRLVDETGWSLPLDATELSAVARRAILEGDGGNGAYYQALWNVLLSVPEGHQALLSTRCDEPEMFSQNTSRFGVCGVASSDGVLVTYAEATNTLGIAAGDRIVKAGSDEGSALLEAAWHRPVCGDYVPSAGGQREFAARSFFGTVPRGMVLTIQPADGRAARTITVPEKSGHTVSCMDPLGRDVAFNAKATRRSDGVAVIRLPRFYPLGGGDPGSDIEAFIAAFQATVQAEFDKVKDAPAIVWDTRGNGGGISSVGLAIVGGMPGAKALELSHCNARIAGSQPPTFDPQAYAQYAIKPGGPFSYGGKVAVIIDGLDYSAADYFARAVSLATSVPLVGGETAGAFGGPGPLFELGGTPKMQANTDVNRCVDDANGEPLEGKGTKPTVPVGYDVQDLRKGIDTVLEAAVARVK